MHNEPDPYFFTSSGIAISLEIWKVTVSRSFVAIWKEWHKSNRTYYPFKFQAILILEDGQVINGLMKTTFELADSDKEQLIEDFTN